MREDFDDEQLWMGGVLEGRGKRKIQTKGRNRWGGKDSLSVMIATDPRFGGVTVQGWNTSTS